ncbi:MAG: hypothetical protein EOO10_03520, partial [Chitinophagaceae bacterium]
MVVNITIRREKPSQSISPPRLTGAGFVQAFAIMENEYGRPLGEIFSSISESPIAAASLGQVPSLSGTH